MRPRNPIPKGPQGHPDAGKWARVQAPAEWEGNFRFEGTRGPPWWAGRSRRASGGNGISARRGEPARAGAGWGEDDFGRGIETQGRSESRPGRKARRGFGTRRRSKASRPSKSRRTSRERELATVHGAGEVENAPLPERDCRASGSEARGFAGDRVWAALLSQGSRAQPLRRQEHPNRFSGPSYGAQAQVEGGGGCGGPGNRPEHPHSRRDVVAGLPIRQDGAFGEKPWSTCRASGGPRWTRGPRGDEVRASGLVPWHGVRRTCADPARLHGGATARGQRAAGTRYRLPARTDSEGKAHCEEGPGSPGRRTEQSACNEGEWSRKRSEPQGRQWDATSPRPFARRNPSRWSETTRADRDFMTWLSWGRRKA
jgi:hypothetical protein